MRGFGRLLQLLFKTCSALILIALWGWGGCALFFSGPGPHWLNTILAFFFIFFLPGAFIFCRSFIRAVLACAVVFVILIIWWQTLEPTNFKDWAPDVAKISHGSIEGDTLTMYNVRNFDYKSETVFHQQWETRTYKLSNLQGVDIFLSYWASEHIAHTILSWDFGSDGHLAVSIETRKDKTQEYSAIKGFFKQFEIAYIAADEEDIIKLRTNFRKERVYLYRLQVPRERAQALLESYLEEMNRLVTKPHFYNALTRNCTTTIQIHADATRPDSPPPLDWRLIASGHVDELLYDRGIIQSDLPFPELRQASRVDLEMQTENGENFSEIIRELIPTTLPAQ